MAVEVLIIVLLTVATGMFTMSEMALLAARKSRLKEWAKTGNAKAKIALELASPPDRFLSAVQIAITLIAVSLGAFGGRTIAERLATHFSFIAFAKPYHVEVAVALVVVGITYLSLIIGELVPKRLALRQPETIATALAGPLRIFSKLSSPIVHLLSVSTDAVCRLFGKEPSQEQPVTEDEINILVKQGTEAGVFEESEQDMVEAVLRLGDTTARALMTPRTQIVWLDLGHSIEQLRERIVNSGHSRFPVARGSLDDVIGVVQSKDLLAVSLAGHRIDINALLQEPLFVPRTISALEMLESFKQSGKHIALVVDEYGGIEGLLTHHDILEAIAGEIPFSEKSSDPKAVQRHDGSWLLDGMLTIDQFKEIFQVDSLPGEKRDAYQTLGGFMFTQMGRVPSVSDSFEWNNLRFEVVDMDGKRIDKVLVSAAQQSGNETDPAKNPTKQNEKGKSL
jgi:putative hemolysin